MTAGLAAWGCTELQALGLVLFFFFYFLLSPFSAASPRGASAAAAAMPLEPAGARQVLYSPARAASRPRSAPPRGAAAGKQPGPRREHAWRRWRRSQTCPLPGADRLPAPQRGHPRGRPHTHTPGLTSLSRRSTGCAEHAWILLSPPPAPRSAGKRGAARSGQSCRQRRHRGAGAACAGAPAGPEWGLLLHPRRGRGPPAAGEGRR